MSREEKLAALKCLAARRQCDEIGRRYRGYSRIGDYHQGRYDTSDFVSPFTRSAGNVDSDLMFVLQDWTSKDKIESGFVQDNATLGYNSQLDTNVEFQARLNQFFGKPLAEMYVTNAFAFVKPGGISSSVLAAAMDYSVRNYLINEVKIVSPKLVVCLGRPAFNGLRKIILGRSRPLRINDQECRANNLTCGDTVICGIVHPSGQGIANARAHGLKGRAAADHQWAEARDLYNGVIQSSAESAS